MVNLIINGGPSFNIGWTNGMTGRVLLEAAFNYSGNAGDFTYSIQYYGSTFGYLVDMINETYDTFISKYEPYYFWEIYLNGIPAQKGIDGLVLNDGDTLTFSFEMYSLGRHKNSSLEAKYRIKKLVGSLPMQ
jgi:hypothetical protein